MTAPPSTPTARELARACVHVEPCGMGLVVFYRVPGTNHASISGLAHTTTDANRMAEDLANSLAPLVDLGLRHREAMQATPATRDPRPVQRIISSLRADSHDANDGDPDD